VLGLLGPNGVTVLLTTQRRPGLLAGTQQALTLTWRSVLKIRTSLEDVVGLSLTPIVFLLLFTYVFGGALAGSSHAYLQFALPGILVYTVVLATLAAAVQERHPNVRLAQPCRDAQADHPGTDHRDPTRSQTARTSCSRRQPCSGPACAGDPRAEVCCGQRDGGCRTVVRGAD
jgi:hypothetical protein